MKYVKLVINFTTVSLLSIWVGHYVGSKGGFQRGVVATTDLISKILDYRDTVDNEPPTRKVNIKI